MCGYLVLPNPSASTRARSPSMSIVAGTISNRARSNPATIGRKCSAIASSAISLLDATSACPSSRKQDRRICLLHSTSCPSDRSHQIRPAARPRQPISKPRQQGRPSDAIINRKLFRIDRKLHRNRQKHKLNSAPAKLIAEIDEGRHDPRRRRRSGRSTNSC